MTWGMVGGAAVSVVGGSLLGGGGSSQSGTQTQTTQQQLDPRIAAMLFGDGTDANKGLLSQYQGYFNQPQGSGTAAYGQAAQNFLQNQAPGITSQLQNGSTGLLNSSLGAPQAANTGPVTAAFAHANVAPVSPLYNSGVGASSPSQNALNLTNSYDKLINGDAAANPYLTSAIQSGVDATNAGYNKNVNTLTDQLQRSVLPGIRSNAVLAGQYGGTRQGIAEGNAIGDFTRQLNDNNAQLAASNSANAIGAQAQAYNQGQDRSLSALQGLSGLQYQAADANANRYQQANLQNQMLQNNAAMFNSSQNIQNNQFNAGQQQQANLANMGTQQQTNLANQAAQISTNGLNSNNQLGGLAGLSGLLGSQYGVAQGNDAYGLNRATQVNGLISPYIGANSTQSQNSPLYQNTGANILGGATAGLGLYNGLKNNGLFGSNTNNFMNNNSSFLQNNSMNDLYSVFG